MEIPDDDRYATQRGRQLARTTDLRKVETTAIAYAERGHSPSSIARAMETSEGTVRDYFEKAIALYGFEILEQKVLEGDDLPTYERVDPEYCTTRHPKDGRKWVGIVLDQEGAVDQEFVNDVKAVAMDADLFPRTDGTV